MRQYRIPDIWRFILSIAICQIAGVIGSMFTMPAIPTWYAALAKPSFTPPSSVFAPVWITLYALMGISLFLVWRQSGSVMHVPRALTLFTLQLLLNVLWSAAFFGMRSPAGGLVVIVALWLVILAAIIQFGRVSDLASFLLIPYLLWVTFASILNLSIYLLNR